MSQDVFADINPSTTSGTQLATLLNNFKAALMSGLTGTSRPTELLEGGTWIDTTNEGTPDFYWIVKIWTGVVDIEVFRVNLATSKASFTSADSTFEVAKISADAVGPLLKLIKQRVANNGQVLNDDVVGELQFVGRANDSSNPIVARIKTVASDNQTAGASGAYIVFEATVDNSATLTEMMRLVDGKLGIGTTSPETALHVRSTTGIKSSRRADDASAAKLILRKLRIAGTGASQNADELGHLDFNTTDDATAEATSARVKAVAVEAHTASAQGTRLDFQIIKSTTAALFTALKIGDVIEAVSRLLINGYKLVEANIATAASITALNADAALVNFTGTTATSLKGIDATGLTKAIVLHNNSTASITLENEDAGASAANRFKLPDSAAIIITPGNSVELFYSDADSRWKIKSSAGGSGGYSVTAVESISASGNISLSTTVKRQLRHVQGNAAAVTTATTPFGSSAPQDGTEITLVGNHDDNSVSIPFNDAAKGCVGNFGTIEITKYKVVSFIYSASLDRYVLVQGAM